MNSTIQKALAAPALVVAIVVGFVSAASAQATPTETAVQGGFDDMESMLGTVIVPAVFGLVIAVAALVMGIKWLRRGASA